MMNPQGSLYDFTPLRKSLPSVMENDATNVKRVLGLKAASDKLRSGLYRGKGLEEKLRSDYRNLRGWASKAKSATDSRHVVRLIFGMWKAVIANLAGAPPEFSMTGRTENFKDAAVILNKYLARQIEMNDFFKTWQAATGLCINSGTGVVRKDWEKQVYVTRRPALEIADDLSAREIEVEVEEIVYEGWVDKLVFLEKFFWDPHGYDMKTCGWVIEQDDKIGVRDLTKYFREGVFQACSETIEEIEKLTGGQFRHTTDPRDDYSTSAGPTVETPTFRLDRYYSDDEVFFVLEEKWILNQDREFQRNPFQIRHGHRKPYIHWQFWPLAGEFLGLGIAEMAASSQFYASTAMNLELDGVRDNVMRRYIVKHGTISNTDDVRAKNGVTIVNDMDGIREAAPGRAMGFGLRIEEACRTAGENDLGIGQILQGGRIGGSTSATEASTVAQMAKKQLTVVSQNQVSALLETARMSLAYNECFLDTDTVTWEGKEVPVIGEMFDTRALDIGIDPESISADYSAMRQKNAEIFAQSMDTYIKYGFIDVVAIAKLRARAGNYKPEDFMTLPGSNKPMNVQSAIAFLLAHVKDDQAQAPPQGSQELAQQQGAIGGKIAAGGQPPGAPPTGMPSPMNVNGPQMAPAGISMNAGNPLGVARNGNPRSALGEYAGKGLAP